MDRSEETLDAVRQKLITRSKDKTPAIRIQATGISFLEYSFEAALTVVRDALLQALAALANMQDPHKKDEVYDTFIRMLDEDPKPYGLVFALYIFLPPSPSLRVFVLSGRVSSDLLQGGPQGGTAADHCK